MSKFGFILTTFFVSALLCFSSKLEAVVPSLPSPTLYTATAGDAQVVLKWSSIAPATNYIVRYGTASGVFTKAVNAGNVTTFTVTGLTNGTAYYFVVAASNASATSANSSQLSARPQISAPVLNSAIGGVGEVTLNWNSVPTATNYSIKYGTAWGKYTKVVDVGDVTTFTLSGLSNGTMYFFVVSANNAVSSSSNSAQKIATPRLPTPTLLSVTPGNMKATLTWSPVAGAESYLVKWKTPSDVYAKAMNIGNVNSYTIKGLSNGTTYYFTVAAAVGKLSVSLDAPGISATPGISTATAPATPTLNSPTAGNAQVTLSWNVPNNNGSPITGYDIQYGTLDSGLFNNIWNDDNVPGAVISGLTNGVTYQFRVIARNAIGSSLPSSAVNVQPLVLGTPAQMQYPSAGETIYSSSVNFSWNAGIGATAYKVIVGTNPGANNLADSGELKDLNYTVFNVPLNGVPIYVRLSSLINGLWVSAEYQYLTSADRVIRVVGSGSGVKEYHDPSGWWQKVTFNLSTDFQVVAQNPRLNADGIHVDHDLVRKTGTLHFWGTAQDYFNGTLNEFSFDRSQNIDIQTLQGIFSYSKTRMDDVYISFDVSPSATLPYVVNLQYAAFIPIVRASMVMPYPWNLGYIDNATYDIPATDDFQRPCEISIDLQKRDLVSGDSVAVYAASLVKPSDSLQWQIIPVEKSTARASVAPAADNAQTATISDIRGNGPMILKITNPSIAGCQKEVLLNVGCGCSSTENMCTLDGKYNLSSIDVTLDLGRTQRGKSAGSLQLKTDKISADNATPKKLRIYTFDSSVETLYTSNNILRQIVTPEIFVDITPVDDYRYDIKYYTLADKGIKAGGVYQIAGTAIPLKTWRIENPDLSSTIYNRLKITETQDAIVKTYEYIWNKSVGQWQLKTGDGLQNENLVEQTINGNRVATRTLTDNSGVVASKTQTTYKDIAGPEGISQEIIKSVEDPSGIALTTSRTWDDGGSGRLLSEVFPDGSWIRYEYDTLGRTTMEVHSWLDSPIGTPANLARAIYYDYTLQDASDANLPQDIRKPRLVTEKILDKVVSKTFYVYQKSPDNYLTNIVERASTPSAAYGQASNQRTKTVMFPYVYGSVQAWRVQSITTPDGKLDTYSYSLGTYTPNTNPKLPGTFTAGAGSDERTSVIHGLVSSTFGIANKSTAEQHISNFKGEELLELRYVYNGISPQLVGTTHWRYDAYGHVTHVYKSDGTESESLWGCCNAKTEIDFNGVSRQFVYDSLDRLQTEIKIASPNDITTNYTYDAAGRQKTQTISSNGLSLSTSTTYDAAGRLKTQTNQAGLISTQSYSADNRTTTLTRPGGATEITAQYIDGQTKSITGTGNVAQFYTYGINPDGSRWTQINFASASSPNWEKTTVDLLGRTIKVEKPGYNLSMLTTEYFYNTLGQLVRTKTPGQADTLYEYDAVGQLTRSGLDRNSNGLLDLSSIDRITDTDTSFALIAGSWWQQTLQKVYAADFSATATTTDTQRTRLNGLGTANLTEESVTIDIHGNQTISQTYIDRLAKTTTRVVDDPDSNTNQSSVTTNGLLTSTTSKTGVTVLYGYDSLERQTAATDPRTGTTTTQYNPTTGQVDWVEDPQGRRTSFSYDPLSGQKISETNALGKVTRFTYSPRGEVTNIWGDVPYPVRYLFDNYGRLSQMHTWRSGTSWDAAAFPTSMEAQKDVTTWNYQEATGLLTSKTDAAGQSSAYTYTPEGKLKTRTWARLNSGSPTVTTYNYTTDTGELTGIDYSNLTPDVTFAYDRLGRQKTITDAVGNRTFGYNAKLQPETENISGLYNKLLTRSYAASDVLGRLSGFNTGAGYSVTYGYDAVGRFNSVGWNVSGQTGSGTYNFVPNSDLLQSLTTPSGLTTILSYEPHRDLKTQVKNQFGAATVSQYDYAYDSLGRRSLVKNSGSAFVSPAFNKFNYNLRNELSESARYLGADVSLLTNPVLGEYRHFDYDPIGNRGNITVAGNTGSYSANNRNQYLSALLPAGGTNNFTHDTDGNLTEISGSQNVVYAYDAENRLISATPKTPAGNDKKIELSYDYQGRRVRKVVSQYNGSSWTIASDKRFVYDGWNLIEEQTLSPASSRFYVWGLDLSQSLQGAGGIGGLLATVSGSTTDHFLYDGNGNVGQLVNASGGVIDAQYEYDPYGNLILSTGTLSASNPFRFSTKYLDTETGLYYYGYRYYSPDTGRWLSRDPQEESGGINLYNFTANNPIDIYDIFGLGYWGDVGQVWVGYGAGVKSSVTGLYDVARHPIATAKALYDAAGHPKETKEAISKYYSEKAQTYAGRGEIVFEILSIVIPLEKAREIAEIAKAVRLTKAEKVCKIDSALEGVEINNISKSRAIILSNNKIAGRAAELEANIGLISEGNEVLGQRVAVNTTAGRRVLDYLIKTPEGKTVAVEVKSGNAIRNSSQLRKDNLIATEGGVLVGKNAPADLKDKTLIFETIERRMP